MTLPPSLGFDLETHGKNPEFALQAFRAATGEARIKAASTATQERSCGFLWPDTEKLRSMLRLAIDTDKYLVGWNIVFDVAWLIAEGLEEEAFAVKWLDAMLLWRHAVVEPEGEDIPKTKRKSYSLESAMKEFYPDQAGFKEFDDFQANDAQSHDLLLHRNKEDARWTIILADKFWDKLTERQQRAALIEARCIPLMAKTRVLGINASQQAAQDLYDKLTMEYEHLHDELLQSSPEIEGLNLGSPKQLQTLLYTTWGLPVDRFSKKTGDPSTDKYALFDLAMLDPRAALLKKLREAKNNRKKYAEGTLNSLAYNGDGKVRPQAKVFSTYTSRVTYGSSDKAVREVEKTTKKNGTQIVTKKVEVPSGIALHQWKRGKEYRRMLQAPEGYVLVELDAAGQEFRWMAVASGDETMLSLCAPGEDAHGYMGAQIAQVDYRALVAKVKAGEAEAELNRKCGKFCIAEGELVLTDRGLVPIEKVLLADMVWDGVEWVSHEGLIYQGEQEVITYDGLTATADHIVYLQEGCTARFDRASAEGRRLARTGDGRQEIPFLGDCKSGGAETGEEARVGSTCPMLVRCSEGCAYSKLADREVEDVQAVYVAGEASSHRTCCDKQLRSYESTEEMQRHEAALRESKLAIVQELRSERDSVQVQQCGGSHCVCLEGVAASDVPACGYRSEGQRWSLRAWESQGSNTDREHREPSCDEVLRRSERHEDSQEAHLPCGENSPPRSDVWGISHAEFCVKRADSGSDCRAVAHAKLQTKRTYDLANAGPRHRFTVSNYLISNCNLSYQYRVSARTATIKARVEYELEVDETFIKQTQSIYRTSYPGVGGLPHERHGGYWGSQIQKCRMLGYAETFAGRRVQLKGSWAGRDSWAMESTAINYPIQGTGGDQKYLALAVARNHLNQFDGYFYYELHDGVFFIFPIAKAVKAAEFFEKKLSTLPYKQAWGIDLPIQFPFDTKIGHSWGDLMSLEKYVDSKKS